MRHSSAWLWALGCAGCVSPPPPSTDSSLFARRWPAGGGPKDERFQAQAHKPNYLIVRASNNPNQAVFDEAAASSGTSAPQLQATELKFQLSVKTKLMDDLGEGGSLWAAYTQQSNWQAFNFEESAPFRDTQYEPELIWNLPLKGQIFDWNLRFVNLGFVHQSNGRSESLSRSWNRVYAQFGLEKGPFALLVRPWLQLPDSGSNNSDIEEYYGYGDLLAIYEYEGQQIALTLRNNLEWDENKGSVQLDWTYPLQAGARVYVQLFSGYGESLLDYDHSATTLGIGFQLTDWL